MNEHSKKYTPPEGRLSAHQLDLLVREADDFPATPGITARLLELICPGVRGDCPPALPVWDRIYDLIGCDPALTVRLLRLANRTTQVPVCTVTQAGREMGEDAVRSAMLSIRIIETGSGEEGGLDLAGFGRHCLAVATAAQMLSETLHLPVEPTEAFTCGLLHDFGKLALSQMLPKSYRRVVQAAEARAGNIADCERRIIGTDHTVIARRLGEQWRLGDTVHQVVWMHHQPIEALPESLPDRRLVAVVSLADAISRKAGVGFSGNHTFAQSPRELARALLLRDKELDEITAALAERVEQRINTLDLPETGAETAYRDALPRANAQLGQANEQLQQHTEQLKRQALAFKHLRDLAGKLSSASTVSDTLADIATLLNSAVLQGRPDRGIVGYSIADETREVLIVRVEGANRPTWKVLPRGERFDPQQVDKQPGPAAEALEAILEAPEDLNEWVNAMTYRHQAFPCAGRWIGGVLFPADATTDAQELIETLSEALGMALGIVQERCRAVLLSEQLACESQVLGETHANSTDAKTVAAAGEMAAGAAHELNTPLAVVSGRAQLMREQANTDPERKAWGSIAVQAQRISDTVTELMEFASPPPPRPQRIDVENLLQEAINPLSGSDHLQAATARVDIEVAAGLPHIWADRDQIREAIAELIANAVTATGTTGSIRLSAAKDPSGGAVVITVADNGPGMDERTLEQAFTPFFSLQKAGRRRGLGLPRVRRYAENNGGRVWIRTRLGEGTSVYLELPPARKGPENGEISDADPNPRTNSGGG